MSLLEVEDLTVHIQSGERLLRVVDGVGYRVDAGEVFGVAGESGSGKTMSMLAILGLLPDAASAQGSVRLDGRELLGLSPQERRSVAGREIAMVFQDPMTSLHPMLTVGSQLTDHMRFHLRLGKAAAESRAAELLDEVRIPDPKRALRAYPHQFSGGMRQRIAIAVALACGPKLLIADEPTSALDVTVQAGILRLLDRLRCEHGLSVILVTHDLGVMSAIANRLSILYAGRIVECGSRTAVLQHPRHPYTRALLDALPQAEPGREPLAAIGGTSPRPDDLPSGCPFHPRCAYARASCGEEIPQLRVVDERELACPVNPFAGA